MNTRSYAALFAEKLCFSCSALFVSCGYAAAFIPTMKIGEIAAILYYTRAGKAQLFRK